MKYLALKVITLKSNASCSGFTFGEKACSGHTTRADGHDSAIATTAMSDSRHQPTTASSTANATTDINT